MSIQLFNINNYKIDTSNFSHLLHDKVVKEFEENFAKYVGAKYSCMANSASSLLFLSLLKYKTTVSIPSTMPVVVPNVIINTGNKINFYDDTDWVGHMYHLHDNIFDSAQEVKRNQYKDLGHDDAIMIFSFYPTKPVGGCDGGMVVSNNLDQINYFRTMTMNGTNYSINNWEREHISVGYKMHPNSFQAYIANKNLKRLDKKNKVLYDIRSYYNLKLGLRNDSLHLYRINVNNNRKFLKKMHNFGIQCGIHYEHCHEKKCFVKNSKKLSRSEKESISTVSIPFNEKLKRNEVEEIVHYVKKFSHI